jgi:hypothetical protein
MNRFRITIALACLASVMTQCSDSENAGTVYGTMTFTNTSADKGAQTSYNDDSQASLSKLTTCKRDADLGIFDFEASSSDGRSSVKFRIKGFKSTMETYVCKQATDNVSGTGLGNKYDTCTVGARVTSPTGTNTYAMRDEAEKNQNFSYTGTCQIQFGEASPRAKGRIQCTKMVQTGLNGSTRNPISESVTGDLSVGV